ncbi:hypothetical protein CDO44_26435 [Pigmentiphaga sp. NML080357]|uniref:hypothetical protein n=1 Tax=Pigmentiphaga sp. NML080357 TaxID=2008675 RepID=UPI000B41BBDD|nr:hypothetical protein [Pigmentiphaga sp. NML080357]OVZ54290.1 hypothetical protein CDO44_26435 [Pigmentiphaga sp. NML080357]
MMRHRWARISAGRAALARIAVMAVLAAAPAWTRAAAPRLPSDAVDLGWGGRMRVNGIDVEVQLFGMRKAPLALAAELVRQPGLDAWLLPMPDGVMLSGADRGRPWLVQLRQAGPEASEGMLAVARGGRPAMPAPAPWLPDGGALLLDLESEDEGGKVVHQVYGYPDTAAALTRFLAPRLRALGWRRAAGAHAASEWRRAGRLLRLLVVEREVGSGLVAVETDADPASRRRP